MPQSSLLVCERTGRWAIAFRRALGRGRMARLALRELRSLADCAEQLAAEPTSLVAIEVTAANLEGVLAAHVAWQRRYPRCRLMALADESLASAEHLLREAGAVAVLRSIREVPKAARLAQRHAAEAPPEELPLPQTLARRLPWPQWATTPG